MFHNDLTRKMPCWDCKNDRETCEIINGISMIPSKATKKMRDLTFICESKVI